MNERIKELAEQALKSSMVHAGMYRPEGYANGVSKEFADKFAELMINKCASILSTIDKAQLGSGEYVDPAEMIKKHFGVDT